MKSECDIVAGQTQVFQMFADLGVNRCVVNRTDQFYFLKVHSIAVITAFAFKPLAKLLTTLMTEIC